jgi:hypothetical protein
MRGLKYGMLCCQKFFLTQKFHANSKSSVGPGVVEGGRGGGGGGGGLHKYPGEGGGPGGGPAQVQILYSAKSFIGGRAWGLLCTQF